jgi:S-adenosyl-l-methionine hydroxide adenosyltransferase
MEVAMLLHIIADYGHGDLAFAEVVQRFKLYLPQSEPVLTPVPSFATLAAGFCIAQLALNPAPEEMVIFHNIAPRADDETAREENQGEELAYARLPNGVQVIGVNAGYTFSFLRDEAEELRRVNVAAEGSQFRSRDLFPEAAARILRAEPEALGDEIRDIPEVPADRIAYIDGYGNLKTTVPERARTFENGQRLRVTIGRETLMAFVSDGSFAVEPGAMAFAPGSSGWKTRDGKERRWLELFLRGGSAAEKFGQPKSGDLIEFTPAG